jgi:hypothetical protein
VADHRSAAGRHTVIWAIILTILGVCTQKFHYFLFIVLLVWLRWLRFKRA